MAIVPQVNLSTENSTSSIIINIPFTDMHDEELEHGEAGSEFDNKLQKLILESTASALSSLDARDCIYGDCPPVEIPLIAVVMDVGPKTRQKFGIPHQYKYYRDTVYDSLARTIERLNSFLSREITDEELLIDNVYFGQGLEVGSGYPKGKERTNPAMTSSPYSYFVSIQNYGYYTGAEIYDETLGDFVDEFVSFRSLRHTHPNIKFVFPKKIRTEYVNYLYNKTFNIPDLYNFLGESKPSEWEGEFLYFHANSPGLLLANTDYFDQEYYTALRLVSASINQVPITDTGISISSRAFFNYGSVHGLEHFFDFDAIAYVNTISKVAVGSMTAGRNTGHSYGANITTHTGSSLNALSLAYHEYMHGAISGNHSWFIPTFGYGFLGSGNEFYSDDGAFSAGGTPTFTHGIITPATSSQVNLATLPSDLVDVNVLNNPLKPPFKYSYKNPHYDRIKRDSDKADLYFENFMSEYGENADRNGTKYKNTTKTVALTYEVYLDNKTVLNSKLDNTPEFYTGSYADADEDLFAYTEYLIDAIKDHTQNFTLNYTFESGPNTPAKIVAPPINRGTGLSDKISEHILYDIYKGLDLFWGGSFVINNPPEIFSTIADPVGGVERKVFTIKNQQYASVFKMIGRKSIPEYQEELNNNPTWRLAKYDDLSILRERLMEYKQEDAGVDAFERYALEDSEHDFTQSSQSFSTFWIQADRSHLVKKYYAKYDSKSGGLLASALGDVRQQVILVKDIDLLEDDSISTSFVVNPTNDDGTRKGPNVTSYVPFCVPTVPVGEDEKPTGTNTYDPTWMYNFNSFNPKYPEYPSNTKIKDLFKKEFCPCLYKEQTYKDDSAAVQSYTIVSQDSTFDALRNIYRKPNLPINNYQVQDIVFDFMKRFHGWIITKLNRGYEIPKTLNLNALREAPNPYYYRYSDPELTYLEAVPAVAYYGFGYDTSIPIAYQVNPKVMMKHIVMKNKYDQEVFDNAPDNAYLPVIAGPVAGIPYRDLRFAHRTFSKFNLKYGNNPYYKYLNDVVGFPSEASEDIYEDQSGVWSLLNRSDTMQYNHHVGVIDSNIPYPSQARALNYYYNSNAAKAASMRAVIADNKLPDISEKTIDIGKKVTLNSEEYIIVNISPNPVKVPIGPQINKMLTEVIAINAERYFEGNLLDVYNSDPGEYDPHKVGSYDHLSFPVPFNEFQDKGISISGGDEITDFLSQYFLGANYTDSKYSIVTDFQEKEAMTATGFPAIAYSHFKVDFSSDGLPVLPVVSFVQDFSSDMPLGLQEGLEYIYNHPSSTVAKPLVKSFIVRKFYISSEEAGGEEKYYLEDAFQSVATSIRAYDTQGALGGCNNPDAFNYSSEATFNDGSCIDKVVGCTKSWADNFDATANTDDGSCMAEICLSTIAAGETGFGYDPNLIATVTAYNPEAIVSADTVIAASKEDIDEDLRNSVCQQLFERRNTIGKFICTNVSTSFGVENCNTTIQIIKDKDTESAARYTDNPVIETVDAREFYSGSSGHGRFMVAGLWAPNSSQDHTDTGGLMYPIIDENNELSYPAPDEVRKTSFYNIINTEIVLGEAYRSHSQNTHRSSRVKYNCPENPMLPDGSGGCILITFEGANEAPPPYKLQGCSYPEMESKTPRDCFNSVIFEGGYLTPDFDISAGDQVTPSECLPKDSRYLIGGELVGINGKVAIVTEDSLPTYSKGQVSAIGGYPVEVLNVNQLPFDLVKKEIEKQTGQAYTSDSIETGYLADDTPKHLRGVTTEGVLFTELGFSYIGEYTYTLSIGAKQYYAYSEDPLVDGKKLYTLPDVLNNKDGLNFDSFTLGGRIKKIDEIANKIENLSIFTD